MPFRPASNGYLTVLAARLLQTIAQHVKPFLPHSNLLYSPRYHDRMAYIPRAIRRKGHWEACADKHHTAALEILQKPGSSAIEAGAYELTLTGCAGTVYVRGVQLDGTICTKFLRATP
jgi:hypothetical protein